MNVSKLLRIAGIIAKHAPEVIAIASTLKPVVKPLVRSVKDELRAGKSRQDVRPEGGSAGAVGSRETA